MTFRNLRRSREQAEDGESGQALARSRFAHETEALAAGHIEIDSTQNPDRSLTRLKGDMKVADGKDRLRHRAVTRSGSSRSRRASPSTLHASTAKVMARPAKSAGRAEPNRLETPSRTMLPHEGAGAWAPRPMKLSEASRRMADPI